MLYDLNVAWTPQTTPADLERALRFSKSLGYDVVALNHTFGTPIPANVINPIPQPGPIHSSFPQAHDGSSSSNNNVATAKRPTNLPITLRRATVLISDPSINHRLPALAATYDLLAARPTTEKAFLSACTTMSEISLISLDLTTPFPFHFRPKPCMAAVNRGVFFEICYGQLLSTTNDPRARAVFIGNVIEIFRATRGRGIVISSEARPSNSGGGTLRAPADVVNLFAVWGLSNEKGLEALGINPRSVVVNEGLKRRSFRGVVDIVQVEGKVPGRRGEATETSDGNDEDNGDGGKNIKNKSKQKKKPGNSDGQQQQQRKKNASGGGAAAENKNANRSETNEKKQNGNNTQPPTQHRGAAAGSNGKRKHDGASDHGGGSGGDQNTSAATTAAATSSSSSPAGSALSKRQAKKMKLAQRAPENPSATKTSAIETSQ